MDTQVQDDPGGFINVRFQESAVDACLSGPGSDGFDVKSPWWVTAIPVTSEGCGRVLVKVLGHLKLRISNFHVRIEDATMCKRRKTRKPFGTR